jgi:O-antigen/teichoic acid export membrane protein
VETLFGPKWVAMAPIAAGLALVMPAFALQIVCSPAPNGMGQPRIYMMTNGAGALLFPLLFLAGVGYGPQGLVTAWWIGAPALLLFTYALTLPRIGVRWSELAAALAPALAATGAMALVVGAARAVLPPMPAPAALASLAAIGVAAYLAILLTVARGAVGEIMAFVLRRELAPA